MPTVIITTIGDSNGPNKFTVDQATADRCIEQLADPNAVLELREREGTGYVPVRHITAMWVTR